jgi:integrase
MAKHRGAGEGTIFKRTDDSGNVRYVAELYLGTDAAGKRLVWRKSGRKRKDVADALAKAIDERNKGMQLVTEKQTLAEFLTAWLDDVAKPKLRPRVHLRYEQLLRLHVIPHLGHVLVTKLTPQQLQALYSTLGESLAPRTVGHVHRCLHVALETAVRWGLTYRNVADLVEPPRVEATPVTALSPAQARQLIAAVADDPHEALYVLAVTTGMRQGEILALRWSDVDLDAGRLQVVRSLAMVRGVGPVFQEPKTQKGRRAIALTSLAIGALRRHRARQREQRLKAGPRWSDLDLVFPTEIGTPMSARNLLARSFEPLLARSGLPKIRFHDLRHSTASLLLAMEKHPKIVQEMLGHATIGITLDTYSHLLPSLQAEAVRGLDELLRAETPKEGRA